MQFRPAFCPRNGSSIGLIYPVTVSTTRPSSSDIHFQDFVANVLNNRQSFNLSRPRFSVSDITMSSLAKMFYHYVLSCRFEELEVRKKVQISDQMLVVDRLSRLPDTIIHHVLSLMETKYAVRTCVLSKQWRNHWTNIHSLSFDRPSFSRWFAFKDLVLKVLQHRKSFDLRKLKFICRAPAGMEFVRAVFEYVESHRLEELDTDVIGDCPPSVYGWNTLKTLKIFFTSTLPRLVTLTISDFRICKKIKINAPRLQFLNWKGESPCSLSFRKCSALDKVDIHMSPPVDFRKKKWLTAMRNMVKGCCHAKSIDQLHSADAEIKVVDLSKETGEERLLFAFPMVSGFDLNRFATILREIYALSKSLEELDTNLTTLLPGFYRCQTLRTLKLSSCSIDLGARDLAVLSSLTLLTTLEFHDLWLSDCEFFPRCLFLENLSIIRCMIYLTTLNISAPRLVKLIISSFKSWKKVSDGSVVSASPKDVNIVITAPRLKFFHLKEMDPVVLSMVDCPALEKVDIHRSQPFRPFVSYLK
ncbi:hypothetical protein EZV62_025043 [Acer yangbiense]|uniref:F-box domain-containing protein n=1 Tax=Acer yangbiense TaxID=1000413 RepID=A0A5C7GWQ5_9ROSI|nr:hypothetical protein EZV62_025043 [Acer yangbiense]